MQNGDGGGADTPETLDELQDNEDLLCVKETDKQRLICVCRTYVGSMQDLRRIYVGID